MRTIALLTDFGTRDPYVAAMKGVIAARCEHRQECLCHTIVDLTHDIAPFDVWEAAFFLRDVVRYWPNGTIFVCVVDPGVGTARRRFTGAIDSRRWPRRSRTERASKTSGRAPTIACRSTTRPAPSFASIGSATASPISSRLLRRSR